LFRHGLKSMKVNFNIFPGQHNHQMWTSLNHSGQLRKLEWEQIPISNISKATWRRSSRRILYKMPLETVQNLYELILRRTAALLEAKSPTSY
jgi:hypothetical protein